MAEEKHEIKITKITNPNEYYKFQADCVCGWTSRVMEEDYAKRLGERHIQFKKNNAWR